MAIRTAVPAVVAAGILGLVACGTQTETRTATTSATEQRSSTSAAPTTSRPPAPSRAPASVPDTLKFTAKTVDGKAFDGRSLHGKPVLLWFWAPWCSTCAAQSGLVDDLAKTHRGDLSVVGVAGRDQVANMKRFIKVTETQGLVHLADRDGAIWRRFEIAAQSTFVILDESGAEVRSGHLDPDELRRLVDKLVFRT